MPILDDIMDHDVLGPAIREGIAQGSQTGKHEEAVVILRRQMTKRFGPLPGAIEDRLRQWSVAELENLAERFVDATSLADLFGRA